jgi:hypothetical protein
MAFKAVVTAVLWEDFLRRDLNFCFVVLHFIFQNGITYGRMEV